MFWGSEEEEEEEEHTTGDAKERERLKESEEGLRRWKIRGKEERRKEKDAKILGNNGKGDADGTGYRSEMRGCGDEMKRVGDGGCRHKGEGGRWGTVYHTCLTPEIVFPAAVI